MAMDRTTPIEQDPARLEEALPWYLNGTLGEADRAWVEQMLAAESQAAERAGLPGPLEFDSSVAAAFEDKLAEIPADIGWSRLLQRTRADAAPAAAARSSASAAGPAAAGAGARESWLQRVARLFAPMMSPQIGMAMAVLVAVQAIAIGVLVGERQGGADTVEYRSGTGAAPVAAVRALLNENITEKALREALIANGASIVEGPNALGEYWIVTGDRDPEAVAQTLRGAGVVSSYVIDRRLPGR